MHGFIFDFVLKYISILVASVGILIFLLTLFSNGKDYKFIKYSLVTLTCISLVTTSILLAPIGIFVKTKQFFELFSRFRITLTKLVVFTASLTVSSLIISMYLGAAIVLFPLFDHNLDGSYIFILLLMVLFMFSFRKLNKCIYKLSIYATKSHYSKRQLLQSYFEDHKEKNIILFLLFFFATLYLYSQKHQDNLIQASTASITTIVLFDALIDKWKSRFHKTDDEYRLIELINIDLQIIISQIDYCRYTNINIKLVTNNHLEFMRRLSTTSKSNSFKKIFNIYEKLSLEYHPYEPFVKHLYELESKIIDYFIQSN